MADSAFAPTCDPDTQKPAANTASAASHGVAATLPISAVKTPASASLNARTKCGFKRSISQPSTIVPTVSPTWNIADR
jgi:hypothetical protein